jgi:transposase-like protein
MVCPKCKKTEAFWIHGKADALYKCDACGHEFVVDLDRWSSEEKRKGRPLDGNGFARPK